MFANPRIKLSSCGRILFVLVIAGCSSAEVPSVPKERLEFERPLAQVAFPQISRTSGTLGAVNKEAATLTAKGGCDLEFSAIFEGKSQEAPRILVAQVVDAAKRRCAGENLNREKVLGNKVFFKTFSSVRPLAPGAYSVSLRDFGPPISKEPFLVMNLTITE